MSGTVKVVIGVVAVAAVGYFAITLLAPKPAVTSKTPQANNTAFLGGLVTSVASLFSKGSNAFSTSGSLSSSAGTDYSYTDTSNLIDSNLANGAISSSDAATLNDYNDAQNAASFGLSDLFG